MANYNLLSLDIMSVLKKHIKDKVLEGAVEEDDELCKRMNRGLIKIADVFDLIGKLYVAGSQTQNPSKFKRRATV